MDRYDKLEKDNQDLISQLDICREKLRLTELQLAEQNILKLTEIKPDQNDIVDDIGMI